MIPEREREALMRLTMCAREECIMCEYHKECDFDFQYELATESMNILAEALRKTEPTCSKMEQVDKPKTDCNGCKYFGHDEIEACGYCRHRDLYEPQTERSGRKGADDETAND